MKKSILFLLISFIVQFSWGQNIDDNRVSFTFTQFPMVNIEEAFRTYEIRTEHSYLQSNQDSLTLLETRKEQYAHAFSEYKKRKDLIEVAYLRQLSEWQKKENANSSGTPLLKPKQPIYPTPPDYSNVINPMVSTDFSEASSNQAINIEEFKKGLGGSILTIDIQAIRNIRIKMKKSGTGSNIKS